MTSTTEQAQPQGALEQYVRDAIRSVGIKAADLTPEQRERAMAAPKEKAGLRGKSLGTWIAEAKNGREQVAEAQAERKETQRKETQRKNITASSDPDAKRICIEAKEFAGVKSPFSPKEGREFLDGFELSSIAGPSDARQTITIKNKLAGVEATLFIEEVRAFAKGTLEAADAKTAVRAAMSELAKETTLWGRKLAAFISVKAA